MSILRILAAASENTSLRWVRLNRQYETEDSGGEATLERLEADAVVELIIPTERVSPISVKVSPDQRSRLTDDNLQWLVEPYVSQDPGQLHLVRGNLDSDENLTIFAVDRDWLTKVVRSLADKEIRPKHIFMELLLADWTPQTWSVVLKPGGGFVRTGVQSALILDRQTSSAPPLVLQMAVRDQLPLEAIHVYGATDEMTSDFSGWEAVLGVPVLPAGVLNWQHVRPNSTVDLAKGAFSPSGQAGHFARRMKLSASLLLGVMAINAVGAGVKTVLVQREKEGLQNQIEATLMKSFPKTAAILDPLLQMQKNTDRLKSRAGSVMANDFLPLLGSVNGVIGKQMSGKIDAVSFDLDKGIEVLIADTGMVQKAVESLQAAGFSVEQIPVVSTSGVRIRVRMAS